MSYLAFVAAVLACVAVLSNVRADALKLTAMASADLQAMKGTIAIPKHTIVGSVGVSGGVSPFVFKHANMEADKDFEINAPSFAPDMALVMTKKELPIGSTSKLSIIVTDKAGTSETVKLDIVNAAISSAPNKP